MTVEEHKAPIVVSTVVKSCFCRGQRVPVAFDQPLDTKELQLMLNDLTQLNSHPVHTALYCIHSQDADVYER